MVIDIHNTQRNLLMKMLIMIIMMIIMMMMKIKIAITWLIFKLGAQDFKW